MNRVEEYDQDGQGWIGGYRVEEEEVKTCKFHSIMSEQYGEKEKDCHYCKELNK